MSMESNSNNTPAFNDRYITIFENTGAGTILIDADTTIILVNSRFASMLGYDKQEIEGRVSWTQFIHEDDVERMKEYHCLRRKDPDSAPKNYEFRIYTKDKQILYIYITIDMIPGTQLSVASLTDITQLVETREALRKSEEKYRLLVETMSDGLLVQDEHLTIQYVNPRFCDIVGYDQQYIIGQQIKDFIHPHYYSQFDIQMEKRQFGIQEPYEMAWMKDDGTIAHTIVSPKIVSDEQGRFLGSFAVVTDITQRKNWEEALKQSEELFAKVFDATPVGLALIDMQTGMIVKWNKAFEILIHVPLHHKPAISIFDIGIIKKRDIQRLYKQLIKFNTISDYEISLKHDSKEYIAILSAEVIYINDQKMVIISLTDITEKRMLEKEIILISEKERQTIGQDLHDDLIPHLLGIDALCKVMIQELSKNILPLKEDVENIRQLLDGAIVKTRQFSRGLTPSYFIEKQGLSALVHELIQTVAMIYGITCTYICDKEISISNSEVLTHVYHIIQEAVYNAVKHSKSETINIVITETHKTIMIVIEDKGYGFDIAHVRGMGLKIMRHRAAVIGAELKITSMVNAGTTISLTIDK